MKKNAFTLAEVLITLAIVGVVAAVTLPTLNTNVQKQGLSSQIAKFYNQYTKAIEMYKVDNELDNIPASFDVNAFVTKYFKVIQRTTRVGNSSDGSVAGFADTYRTIDGNHEIRASEFVSPGNDGYMLADGAVMNIANNGSMVWFDVNGPKGPNIVGYDLQFFSVYGEDGSIDIVSPGDRKGDPATLTTKINTSFAQCKTGDTYGGCFGHLLRNGFRFDY